MTKTYKLSAKITLLFVFFLATGITKTFAQTENGCVMVNVSYLDNVVFILYGKNKVETLSLKPEAKLSYEELYLFKQTVIIDAINKLEQQGYKLSSSHPLTVNGSVSAYTVFLCKH
jgi:hypothetical protein